MSQPAVHVVGMSQKQSSRHCCNVHVLCHGSINKHVSTVVPGKAHTGAPLCLLGAAFPLLMRARDKLVCRAHAGATFPVRGGLLADEAVQLLKEFYITGNPAGEICKC